MFRTKLLAAVAAALPFVASAATMSIASPATAQTMPGMTMDKPMPAKPKGKPKAQAQTPAKPPAKPAPHHAVAPPPAAPAIAAQAEPAPQSGQEEAAPPTATEGAAHSGAMPGMAMGDPPIDDQHMDHAMMAGDDMAGMPGMGHGGHGHHRMKSAFGPYAGNRDASGTSWQPDTSPHYGLHGERGGWDLMLHGGVDLVFDHQSGPRGDDKAFVLGHIMGAAARDLSPRDRLQIRVAVTPDPLMGPRGYPLLFATGETADGKTQLIDRQHPHDLISELSVALSHRFADQVSAYAFYGEVGDPAFGPPAYVHRLSIQDDPEAPISHHWLDSTHGTQGVITGGLVVGGVKIEASAFRGREPDQNRYDIEAPKFDSFATRVSWNPTGTLALQASYAYQRSPEQVTPEQDQRRYSASAIYTRPVGANGFWSTTLAWGRRIDIEPGSRGDALDAFVIESAVHPEDKWTLFGRAERVENDELLPAPGAFHGDAYSVGKLSIGVIRDVPLGEHVKLGLGTLVSATFVPAWLDTAYGGDRLSGSVFFRLKLD